MLAAGAVQAAAPFLQIEACGTFKKNNNYWSKLSMGNIPTPVLEDVRIPLIALGVDDKVLSS